MPSNKESKTKQNSNETKEKMTAAATKVFSQARESLKFVESYVENYVKIPEVLKDSEERKRLTNEKILSSLEAVGLATRTEVEALEKRIEQLESDIGNLKVSLMAEQDQRTKQEPTASA